MARSTEPNHLYYGDNLDVLRRYLKDESVDLIYLDPPFNSAQDYNVLFAEHSGERAAAQIKAFQDTWRWDRSAEEAYADVLARGGRIAEMAGAMRGILGESEMMAYLAMMAPRLIELRRVLKPAGTIYLHCDPTASHYLKLLLDGVFGPAFYRNEIIWQRTNARSTAGRWPRLHDVILMYAKGSRTRFEKITSKARRDKLPHTLVTGSDGRKYQTYELTAPGVTKKGESGRPWRGFDPAKLGRHWANSLKTREDWDHKGLIHWAANEGWPRRRDEVPFDEENRVVTVGDVWTDIDRINQTAKERLGYPTQKPEALLERIITASSREGDVVLDPFCGCGTAVAVAQRLKRRWIGIDITHLAIGLIKHRLKDTFGGRVRYEVIGEPTSVPDARTLAAEDRFQFQWWALGLVGARPVEQKKGSDRGIDGRLFFQDEAKGRPKTVTLSVKSGRVSVRDVRDLLGVVERDNGAIGVLITLEPATRPMLTDATAAGFYDSPGWGRRYPRLQILTVQDILAGAQIEMPPSNVTYKKAAAAADNGDNGPSMFEEEE